MNAFDFDNTLYHGESSVDFALFMMKHNKKIILWLPTIFWNLMKYKLCLLNKANLVDMINEFLQSVIRNKQEILDLSVMFWKKYRKNLDTSLISKIRPDDMVVTAGPSFLLDVIKSELGTSHWLCSEVDLDKKCMIYLNFGENKVKRFRESCKNKTIDCFYTDSYNDQAMMDISKKVFLVTKGKLKQIK